MKVGIYFREAELPEGGGGGTFEASLIDELIRGPAGGFAEVVFLGPSGSVSERVRSAGHGWVELPHGGLSRAWLRMPRPSRETMASVTEKAKRGRLESGFDRRIARSGIDFLWCLGPDVPTLEIPFAMTVWDLQHRLQPFFPEVSREGIWDRRERYFARTLRRAAVVVTGTEVGKAEIERFYGVDPERIAIAPHPTPSLPAVRSDTDVASRHGVRAPFVFYPAQFWPHKNHVGLLRAVALVREQGLDLDVALAGSDWGGNRAHVESVASSLGLAGCVHFLGFVSREDLAALYSEALCLAYVSYFGPENLPPLEAFAMGCPVIAADVPGAGEQLGDAAVLVPPDDPAAIAAAIRRLAEDEGSRKGLIERGTVRASRSTARGFIDDVTAAIRRFTPIRENWPPG